jgi:hypothetical protein
VNLTLTRLTALTRTLWSGLGAGASGGYVAAPSATVDVELLDANGLILLDADSKTLLSADQVFGLSGDEWLQLSDGSIFGVSPA